METDPRSSELYNRFAKRYRVANENIMREMERAVCGCDYGGSSWTTESEAQILASSLSLIPGKKLLEIGCGSGWPGLYIAHLTGCKATLTDISLEGLEVAKRRAKSDGLIKRCKFAHVGGGDLPFEDVSFDAINHSDVLCCLEEKLDVLHECKRVIRNFGVMSFSVIHMKDDATESEIKRVSDVGPLFIDAPASYPEMLERTGWRIASQFDVTEDYAKAVRQRIEEYENRTDKLRVLLGDDQFNVEFYRLKMKLEFVEEGLTRRTVFVVKP